MKRLNLKLTIIGLILSGMGLVFTVFPVSSQKDEASQNITVIQNNVLSTSKDKKLLSHAINSDLLKERNQQQKNDLGLRNYAELNISGMKANIEIRESKNGIPYTGGSVSSMNAKQIIYLPIGQVLTVKLSGMGANLKISKVVADQVQVSNTGMNSNVSVF